MTEKTAAAIMAKIKIQKKKPHPFRIDWPKLLPPNKAPINKTAAKIMIRDIGWFIRCLYLVFRRPQALAPFSQAALEEDLNPIRFFQLQIR